VEFGRRPPAPRLPRPDAPKAALARVSPVKRLVPPRGHTALPYTSNPGVTLTDAAALVELSKTSDAAAREADEEAYYDELVSFALESSLRDFLIGRLATLLIGGMSLRLFKDVNGRPGREYLTDVGLIDILAVASDGTLVVLELKRDRGSDQTLGQLACYVGWVTTHLAAGAPVRGAVVARRIDDRLRYAAQAMPGVLLLEYDIKFDVREIT
jgi:endonuclease NucS-like protein